MPLPPLRPWLTGPLAYWPRAWWMTAELVSCGCSWLAMPALVMPQLARLMPVLKVDLAVFSRMSPL